VGTLRVMTPIKTDGSTDLGRQVVYVGEAQLLTQAGLLPLVFEIDATSLADAVEKFAAGATVAIERTRRELEDLRREAASQIVVPPTLPRASIPGAGRAGCRAAARSTSARSGCRGMLFARHAKGQDVGLRSSL